MQYHYEVLWDTDPRKKQYKLHKTQYKIQLYGTVIYKLN